MGGTLALNMLAEAGHTRIGNLERTLAICPPIDLFSVQKQLETRLGRRYDRFFVKSLWQQITKRWRRFPDMKPEAPPPLPRKLEEINEWVIAPSGGFTERVGLLRADAAGAEAGVDQAAGDDHRVEGRPDRADRRRCWSTRVSDERRDARRRPAAGIWAFSPPATATPTSAGSIGGSSTGLRRGAEPSSGLPRPCATGVRASGRQRAGDRRRRCRCRAAPSCRCTRLSSLPTPIASARPSSSAADSFTRSWS